MGGNAREKVAAKAATFDDVDAQAVRTISGFCPKAPAVADTARDEGVAAARHPSELERTIQRSILPNVRDLDYDVDHTAEVPAEWLEHLAASARPSERSLPSVPAPCSTVPLLADFEPDTPLPLRDVAPLTRPSLPDASLFAPALLQTLAMVPSPVRELGLEPSNPPPQSAPHPHVQGGPPAWYPAPVPLPNDLGALPQPPLNSRTLRWAVVGIAVIVQLVIVTFIVRKLVAVFFALFAY